MKRLMKALSVMLALVLLLAGCGGSGTSSSSAAASGEDSSAASGADTLQAIKDRGVLRVGVKDDVPGFGLYNTETQAYEGLEIELAKMIAGDLLGDESKVEFTAVTAATRGQLVDSGDIDMAISTFTITEERKQSYNFSTAYYTDAVTVMVKKDAGINTLADLDGKTVGVATSSTSSTALTAAVQAENPDAQVEYKEFASYPEIKAALDSGRIDAFCVDGSILAGYMDDTVMLLADRFSPQEYGVCIKKSNTDLAEYVDGLITGWLEDGTIDGLIEELGLVASFEG